MKRALMLLYSIVAIHGAFSQTYQVPLALTSPRMNSPEVLAVQTRLLDLGFSRMGQADVWFGPLTKDAVSRFQRYYGFSDDGIVDAGTWNALFLESRKRKDVESAIREANAVLDSKHTKVSHDIMGRSSEGGSADQYFAGNKVESEEYSFYGEIGKVEYQVVYLSTGKVVLKKEYHYPEQFDIEHATIENTSYYFVGKTSVRFIKGNAVEIKIEDLVISDLIK